MPKLGPMAAEMTPRSEAEGRSLDRVQRVLVSLLVIIVLGTISAVLAAYLAVRGDADLVRSSLVGLWVMSGVIGLLATAVVLMINRWRPYHPAVLLGLLPMSVSAYWIFS